jgi:ribose transport system ATP-binding protein
MPAARPALDIRDVSKRFPGTVALDRVDMSVAPGEIHALLGGNGSGKSTLVKVLCGVVNAESGGSLRIAGIEALTEAWSVKLARAAGIHVVHQDPGLFADLSVADNMGAGHGFATTFPYRMRSREWAAHTQRLLDTFAIRADPNTLVRRLRPAERTMLAIARALQDEEQSGSGILILDEPTAALPKHEVLLLFEALRRYAASGRTILFVSHRLAEVLDLCSRITVLRDGRKIAAVGSEGLSEERLAELLLGRQVDSKASSQLGPSHPDPVLQVHGLSAGPLRDLSISLGQGEVLGVAGTLGSGRSTLLRVLFGDVMRETGTVRLNGTPVAFKAPAEAIAAGVALVPEDRSSALFGDLGVDANLSAVALRRYWKKGRLRLRLERKDAWEAMCAFGVGAASVQQSVSTLSGGNQQKLILARWLRWSPKILLLDEPTQGVDVGARADIHAQIAEAVRNGVSIIVVSSDFEELAGICHRVVFLRRGQVSRDLCAPELTADAIGDRVYAGAGA